MRVIKSGVLKPHYDTDPANSWLVAATEAGIPVFTPGWEDSTTANLIVAEKMMGHLKGYPIKSGLEQMERLVEYVAGC